MELTSLEIINLQVFTSEGGGFDVVQKIAKEHIDRQRDIFIRNIAIRKGQSNEEVGAKIRAFDEATQLVDGIFREIYTYKEQKEQDVSKNPAR